MIVVIDYGLGNLASVANALKKITVPYQISSNPDDIKKAKGLILPGVGAAGQGMKNIKKRKLDTAIIDAVESGMPFLGICLGMQLLFERSEEGNVACLGILKGSVKKFRQMRKIPQIGWNSVSFSANNLEIQRLYGGISDNSYFYFVNSYYCLPLDTSITAGVSEYGEYFASVVARKNIVGVQFHPEKSSRVGFILLKNFITNYVD